MDSDFPIRSMTDFEQRMSRLISFAEGVEDGRSRFSNADRQFLSQHRGTETIKYGSADQYLAMVRRFCDAQAYTKY